MRNRREFMQHLSAAAGLGAVPAVLQQALAIPANSRTGTLGDVQHIVVLMQENRSFDHYFGTLNGVRGFADPFPVPVVDRTGIAVGKTVLVQPTLNPTAPQPGRPGTGGGTTVPPAIAPFHLNTAQNFAWMRVEGTPHSWGDAQAAWDLGRMNAWPIAKQNHSMGYFKAADLPFQFALANAFTLCDAYHCSFTGGTNTNRLFLWTGMNDPLATGRGPSTDNSHDWFNPDPANDYLWTTYPERLERSGISWQVYEDMADNFTDNSLVGFRPFRDAWYGRAGFSASLKARGVSTRDLDQFRADALADRLPQVSWIVATAEGSEHPGPSSPAQGADYTAKVLEALVANPDVWAKTVLFINFDENDGFFDHVPPPAAPAYLNWDANARKGELAGGSTVDTAGEYHHILNGTSATYQHRPYGLGPRVPMYVVSPWSKGGWVNSQVADHTSVIRFIEQRFGVREPNISAWRRAVCGDLTTCFNFADPNDLAFFSALPQTLALATRARALTSTTMPTTPTSVVAPVQLSGVRPARALPYELAAHAAVRSNPGRPGSGRIDIRFINSGSAAAVFHVYDRLNLAAVPRRYTVEAGKQIADAWQPDGAGAYDLWLLGPNGWHRHITGNARLALGAGQANPEVEVLTQRADGMLAVSLRNVGRAACTFVLSPNKYLASSPQTFVVFPGQIQVQRLSTSSAAGWYDWTARVQGLSGWSRRFAGHIETGSPSISDPAMEGAAQLDRYRLT